MEGAGLQPTTCFARRPFSRASFVVSLCVGSDVWFRSADSGTSAATAVRAAQPTAHLWKKHTLTMLTGQTLCMTMDSAHSTLSHFTEGHAGGNMLKVSSFGANISGVKIINVLQNNCLPLLDLD